MIDTFLDRLIDLALDEDLGAAGDVTTRSVVPHEARGSAELWAKEKMVLSGTKAFARVFERVDGNTTCRFLKADGDDVGPREKIAELEGRLSSLLIAERTALNIVQRMSGIATLSRAAANALKGTKTKVLDTRKTSPGMRLLAKEAVRHGGATNHRFGLFDGVLIKDNHIAAVGGSVSEALRRAKDNGPRLGKIEIEVTDLDQLKEAIAGGADVVLLDNMDDATMAKAVKIADGRVELEASGNMTLARLPRVGKLGVDFVSMGALTHSARSMDLSLEILNEPLRPKKQAR